MKIWECPFLLWSKQSKNWRKDEVAENTALSTEKNCSPGTTANSGCRLAAFWVTGSTNLQGFGSVAPKKIKNIKQIR